MIKNVFIVFFIFLNFSVSGMNLTYTSTCQSLPKLFGYQIFKGYYLEQFRIILSYTWRELGKEITYDIEDEIDIFPKNTPFLIDLMGDKKRICLSSDALPYLERLRLVHTLGCVNRESYFFMKYFFVQHINSIIKFIFIDLPSLEKPNKTDFSNEVSPLWLEEGLCSHDRSLICTYLVPDSYDNKFFKDTSLYEKNKNKYINFSPEDIIQYGQFLRWFVAYSDNKRGNRLCLYLEDYSYSRDTSEYFIKENIKLLKKRLTVQNAPDFLVKGFGKLDYISAEIESHFGQYGLSVTINEKKENEFLISLSSKV